ncbi:MAG: hypothetical protein LBD23_20485 [Oscillospiraceae bacterium]|nr:hypothetical protein [Oscillospiraceae bacterium]
MKAKKLLCVILATVLVMSMLPMTVLAADGDLLTFGINGATPVNAVGAGAADGDDEGAENITDNQAILRMTTNQLTDERAAVVTIDGVGPDVANQVLHIEAGDVAGLGAAIEGDDVKTAIEAAGDDVTTGGEFEDGDLIAVEVDGKWWFFLVDERPNGENHEGDGGALLPEITYQQKTVADLPTSESFDFILDPQGLYYLTDEEISALVVDGTGKRLGEMNITGCTEDDCEDCDKGDADAPCNGDLTWEPLEDAGQIIFSSWAPYFINDSNHEAAIEIEFEFGDGSTGDAIVTPVTTEAAVTATPTAANVFIGAVFSTTNVRSEPSGFSGGRVLPITKTPQTPLFIFDAAEYEDETTVIRVGENIARITVDRYKNKTDAITGNGTQLVLIGECNPEADWEAVFDNPATDLSIDIVFSLITPDDGWEFDNELTAKGTLADVSGAYGLVVGNSLTGTSFVTLGTAHTVEFVQAQVYSFSASTSGSRAIILTSTGASVNFPLANAQGNNWFIARKATDAGVDFPSNVAPTGGVTGTGYSRTITPAAGWDSGWVEMRIVFTDTGGQGVFTIILERDTPLANTIRVKSVNVA